MVLRLAAAMFLLVPVAIASSVLSHEAVIDVAWDASIKPILQKRFPLATVEDLNGAHAYAYGGAIIQDMGYYPFGNHFFSDATHYLRSGDLIENLLREAKDLNELAFALGSIAHYAGDHSTHSLAVNRSVALLYPKLRRKFGNTVTYENSPSAHLKVEFGLDMLQVAQGHYAPEAYHDFIGFKVSKELLDRAFTMTYGLSLGETFTSVDLVLGTFRFSVANLVPEVTKAAWSARKKEIAKSFPGTTRKNFVYRFSKASYEKEWGGTYDRPGNFAQLLGCLFKALPKIGPLRAFAFTLPIPETEKLFLESLKQTQIRYAGLLARMYAGERIQIPNENFDTGLPIRWGSYGLADKAYEELLHKLAQKQYAGVDAHLRQSLIEFVTDAKTLPEVTGRELAQLKTLKVVP